MTDAVEVLNGVAAKLAAENEALKAKLAAMTERAERAEAVSAIHKENALTILRFKQTSDEFSCDLELERDALLVAVKALKERLADKLKPYEWRPIEEIHEDFGPCLLIDINDPGNLVIGSKDDYWLRWATWTHFAEVPKLSGQRANELIAAMKAAGEARENA